MCALLFSLQNTQTTMISTLSLHDALPIFLSSIAVLLLLPPYVASPAAILNASRGGRDRKSTRLNSSHPSISYAVFCLKKKNKQESKIRLDANILEIEY